MAKRYRNIHARVMGNARPVRQSKPMPQTQGGVINLSAKLDRQLRVGKFTTADPGNLEIIYIENKGKAFCELTIGVDDETRVLPAASSHPVGMELTAILRYSTGGTATISGLQAGTVLLAAQGDMAMFVVSVAGDTRVWRLAYATVLP